jgi:hypothetical protein
MEERPFPFWHQIPGPWIDFSQQKAKDKPGAGAITSSLDSNLELSDYKDQTVTQEKGKPKSAFLSFLVH